MLETKASGLCWAWHTILVHLQQIKQIKHCASGHFFGVYEIQFLMKMDIKCPTLWLT